MKCRKCGKVKKKGDLDFVFDKYSLCDSCVEKAFAWGIEKWLEATK